MFLSDNALVPHNEISKLAQRLKDEIVRVRDAWGSGYDNEYAFLSLPANQQLLQKSLEVAYRKNSLKPDIIVVAGIGGSNLGARAVYTARC
jgi:glucose-6-phosphate isomerase